MIPNPMNTRSNKQLIFGHSLLHKFWRDLKRGKKVGTWTKTDVRSEHARVVAIMRKRGIRHNTPLN